MLSEVNRLENLIIDRPPFELADSSIEEQLRRFHCVVLCEEEHVKRWREVVTDDDVVVPYDYDQTYGVQANIRRALEAIDAEPYNTAYVCFSSQDLREAAKTRVGTIQIGGPVRDVIPDVYYRALADALAEVKEKTALARIGFLCENVTTVGGGVPQAAGGQVLWIPRFYSLQQHISDRETLRDVRLLILGRYFPVEDARHEKHQLSKRMWHLKCMDDHGKVFARAVGGGLRIVDNQHEIDIITRVPPKPSKLTSDHMAWIFRGGCERADRIFELDPTLTSRIDSALIRCIREYGSQKGAGSYENRAANVAGAFEVTRELSGEHVVLLDDILTSGTTSSECAKELLSAGAESVTVMALAMNQRVIVGPPATVECTNDCCENGHLVPRAGNDGQLFWGCSEFHDSGCKGSTNWRQGLKTYNRLNTRDDIPIDEEIEF